MWAAYLHRETQRVSDYDLATVWGLCGDVFTLLSLVPEVSFYINGAVNHVAVPTQNRTKRSCSQPSQKAIWNLVMLFLHGFVKVLPSQKLVEVLFAEHFWLRCGRRVRPRCCGGRAGCDTGACYR